MKTASIIQSNYIPWFGYFSMINDSELFMLYEDVQYTKNDWRNRNKIFANGKYSWLTIPVHQQNLNQRFNEIEVIDCKWATKHFEFMRHTFAKEKNWKVYAEELNNLYKQASALEKLYEINRLFFQWIITKLNIKTKIIYIEKYTDYDNPTKRLLSILSENNVTSYISGPAAKGYLKEEDFSEAGITLNYYDYSNCITNYKLNNCEYLNSSIIQLMIKGDFHGFDN